MDVRCLNCGEPWEVDHLRLHAFRETSHPHRESWDGNLNREWRKYFAEAGYEFGAMMSIVKRCPCCPPENHEGLENLVRSADLMAEAVDYDEDAVDVEMTSFPEIFLG